MDRAESLAVGALARAGYIGVERSQALSWASVPSTEPSQLDIEDCAKAILGLSRATGLEHRVEIGGLILDRLLIGLDRESSVRRVAGHATFERLERALDGVMSRSELHRCALVCHICRKLPFIRSVPHFTISHIEALDGAPLEDQERLLQRAASERWSVRQLRRAKAALQPMSRASQRRATTLAIRRVLSMQAAALEELAAVTNLASRQVEGERLRKRVAFVLNRIEALRVACDACAARLARP